MAHRGSLPTFGFCDFLMAQELLMNITTSYGLFSDFSFDNVNTGYSTIVPLHRTRFKSMETANDNYPVFDRLASLEAIVEGLGECLQDLPLFVVVSRGET
jgi:hypothetical protein